jgi:long-chain acyl-CoA synthetase
MYRIERFTIPEVVEKSAAQYGDRPALSMLGGVPLSYRDLESGSRRVAAFLLSLGARNGDRVALVSENRPEWGLAWFGIVRAGCVAVPVLTDFTSEQMANIVGHSGARIVFASRRFAAKAGKPADGMVVAVEDCAILSAPEGSPRPLPRYDPAGPEGFPLPEAGPDDLAAIVYTSGTTGGSKGVMLTHRNLVHDAWSVGFIMGIGPADRLLSILPLAHTYEFSVGFLYPLMRGSSIHFLDRPPSASVLLPALKSLRPTIMLTVPLIIEKVYAGSIKPALERMPLHANRLVGPLLERVAGARLRRSFGGRLRIFGIGGAPISPEVEGFLHRIHFPCAMGYGLTETSPLAAGSSPREFRLRSIGPAIHGTELRIADARPDTGEGEIQVRGPNVMAGYYRDAERTREAFTPDGWLRTGDLGAMDAQGRLSVRGRLKSVIIGPNGENIYPEEVEAVINSSPFVAESLVYGDDAGLTALVQLKPEIVDELVDCAKEAGPGADKAEEKFGRSVGQAIRQALEQAGAAEQAVERAAGELLAGIRKETNARLAAFSRITRMERQLEPFEKTPTQKIKRFLYARKAGE